ncbi:MAG: hypothetical protein ABI894_06900 [Ilumatobacteraceae bacterium]
MDGSTTSWWKRSRHGAVAPHLVCLTEKRACPPEDCGGPLGDANLLATLEDPSHEDHNELAEWVPPGFDAEAFDVDETTEMMRSARPLRDW